MKTPWVAFILLSFASVPYVADAEEPPVQNSGSPRAVGLRTAPPDRGGSVYRINPAIDYPVIGAASLGASLPLLFESQIIHRECPCDPNEVNSFDRPVIGNHNETAGTISHVVVTLSLAAPLVLDGVDQGFNKIFAEDALVYIEALSINSAVSHIARYGLQRARPTAYEASPPETRAGEFLSFYSGHTASVFASLSAASMTYGYRYGHSAWPWLVTVGLGVGESVLRVAAGRHFYTDVIAGAVMGTVVGTLVPYLHRRDRGSSLTLAPTAGEPGVLLVWQKKF